MGRTPSSVTARRVGHRCGAGPRVRPRTGGRSPDKLGHKALTGLSCPSACLCVGVTSAGRTFASTAPATSSWRLTTIDSDRQLTGVSCPTVDLCVAADAAGNVLTSTRPSSGPRTAASIDPGLRLSAITGASDGLCVAADGAGDIFSSTDPTGGAAAWTEQSGQDRDIDDVSCTSTSLCVATDADGAATVGTPVA